MIEILAYHGRSFVSKWIRFCTRSPITHVAMRRDGVTVEAWHKPLPHGAVCAHNRPLSAFALHTAGTRVDVLAVPRLVDFDGEWIEEKVWRWAMRQVGTPYDFQMVVRFALRWDETAKSRGKLFCSEYVAKAFVKGGYPLLERMPTSYTAPSHIYSSPLLNYTHSELVDGNGKLKQWTDARLVKLDKAHDVQFAITQRGGKHGKQRFGKEANR